jgi:nucleoside 2-deoxyribosyltransferase
VVKKAYLAGDGLKRGNQILRGMERDALNGLGTLDLFNPWDQKDINDKSKNPTAEMIFAKDTAAMLEAEVIVVDVDNNSVGTTAEMGQMWGVNYMLERIEKVFHTATEMTLEKYGNHWGEEALAYQNQSIVLGLHAIRLNIPKKEIHWQTTDVRDTDIPEAGHRRSHSINQYLYGMMLDMAGEPKKFDEILEALK